MRRVDMDARVLPEGTTLRREYGGVLHEVRVSPPATYGTATAARRAWWRYLYAGRLYKSLSAVAYRITGDRYCSGNRFFGLRGTKRRKR